jgi:hypothetical protein
VRVVVASSPRGRGGVAAAASGSALGRRPRWQQRGPGRRQQPDHHLQPMLAGCDERYRTRSVVGRRHRRWPGRKRFLSRPNDGRSTCIVLSCSEGYSDCDGVGSNGCEVSTLTDSENCGACKLSCATSCAAGRCLTTLASNQKAQSVSEWHRGRRHQCLLVRGPGGGGRCGVVRAAPGERADHPCFGAR